MKPQLRGFSLIEMLITIALLGIATFGVFRFLSNTTQETKSLSSETQAFNELELLSQNIHDAFTHRKAEVMPVPNPPINLKLTKSSAFGISPAADPCLAPNPCFKWTITQSRTNGSTKTVSIDTLCNGKNYLPGINGTLLHAKLPDTLSVCAKAPTVEVKESTGEVNLYPAPKSTGVTAVSACVRCYNQKTAFRYAVELSAAYATSATNWGVVRKTLFLATDETSPGIEMLSK